MNGQGLRTIESTRETTVNDESRGAGVTLRQGRKRNQGKKESLNDKFSTKRIVGDYTALCRNPLQDLRGWMGSDHKMRGGNHCLSTRPRRGFSVNDRLQPLRIERGHAGRGDSVEVIGKAATKKISPVLSAGGDQVRERAAKAFSLAAQAHDEMFQRAVYADDDDTDGHEFPQETPSIDQGFITAAYEVVFNNLSGAIASAESDKTKSAAERSAIVAALRKQQSAAASKARTDAMQKEIARVKGFMKQQRPAQKQRSKMLVWELK